MANTFVKLSSVTVGAGGASTISFTNIPQTYTDLKIVLSTRRSTATLWGTYVLTINGDSYSAVSTTNYGSVYATGDGANFTSNNSRTNSAFVSNGVGSNTTSNTFDNTEVSILDYCNNQNIKIIQTEAVGENQATTAYSVLSSTSVHTTDPVTSVTFYPGSGTFLQNSTATLYGIFNADVSTAPSTPTIGTATAGAAQASITFTGVSNASSYTMTSTPDNITGSGAVSPITVSGLTAGTSYTFKVKANNPFGSSAESAASNSITPVGAGGFESIAGVLVTADTSTVSFTSIPNTYTHLQVRIYGGTANGRSAEIQFNSDTGTNYSYHRIYSNNGSTIGSGGFSSQTRIPCGSFAGFLGSGYFLSPAIIDILDYSNTNKNKVTRSITGWDNNTGGYLDYESGAWYNTNAINRIDLKIAASENWLAGSMVALYGIRSA